MESKKYPKITVVTPNFNQGDFIERTILSVLEQNYPSLEYIVIDGSSNDHSVDIIKKYDTHLHYWVSEPDEGMYHAINKGFALSSGVIMCWINSDDVLWEGALHYVATQFIKNEKLQWLQGYPSVIDEDGRLLYQRDPVASKYHFYLKRYEKDFSFIQQESTFWTRELWKKTGSYLSLQYSMASDFELWLRFFKYEELYCTKKQLAAFRKRKGQKSGDGNKYLFEAGSIVKSHLENQSWMFKIKLKITKLFRAINTKTIIWIDK